MLTHVSIINFKIVWCSVGTSSNLICIHHGWQYYHMHAMFFPYILSWAEIWSIVAFSCGREWKLRGHGRGWKKFPRWFIAVACVLLASLLWRVTVQELWQKAYLHMELCVHLNRNIPPQVPSPRRTSVDVDPKAVTKQWLSSEGYAQFHCESKSTGMRTYIKFHDC